ncbi:sodium:sulfate symporter [Halostagnicola larsenii XH-48]|uniref:Sodium:sulfate symporter n=1 Tax=Halostagnicola larsenii XH-48 TaxID=797299 RepID=W0JQM9_9EURY|nr:SLC13 family permease [Halostagnicola larsenii]AHF99591.1 sodium:sulfate symporter [Halostagnicola larsenii XH-48]
MERRTVLGRVKSPPVSFFFATAVALVTWVALADTGTMATMLSITLFCIILWVLTPVPPAFTGILGIGLIAVTFSTDLALTGFQEPATWLIGFGLLMGEATRRSGLANWAGSWMTSRSISPEVRSDPTRAYRRLLLVLSLGAHALALLVPSSLVRILVLAPILKETGSLFDSRQARVGIYLGPLFATFYGSPGILTADLPNIILTGFAQSIAGQQITWTEWALHMYPVMGILRVLLVIAVTYYLFRPETNSGFELPDTDGGTAGETEKRMLLILLVGAVVWATDFVHGFHPVVGALVVVVLAFLPSVGVVDFREVGGETDYSILFFIAAVFAIGDGLSQTGFSDGASTYLLELIPTDAPLAIIFACIFFITLALTFVMEGLAVASVLTPVLIPYAEAAGLPLTPVLMSEVVALSSYFFPYQSAVLIVMLAEGDVETKELITTTIACSLATIAFLLPLQFAVFSLLY